MAKTVSHVHFKVLRCKNYSYEETAPRTLQCLIVYSVNAVCLKLHSEAEVEHFIYCDRVICASTFIRMQTEITLSLK